VDGPRAFTYTHAVALKKLIKGHVVLTSFIKARFWVHPKCQLRGLAPQTRVRRCGPSGWASGGQQAVHSFHNTLERICHHDVPPCAGLK
jgi:hypothetical protein